MAQPNDYLNQSELRRLNEISKDLADLMRVRKDLNREKKTIKARAAKRLDDAERKRRRAEAEANRVVI